MLQKGLVTIILPIYNVEKYLDRCIQSVVNQTYTNLEIILVDDGSPDNCPSICDTWAKKDSRIKVVHKENAGLGMARNTGIDNATGEYICFFDSDDYISHNAVEKAFNCAKKNNAEMILFGFCKVKSNKKIQSCIIPATDKSFYEDEEILSYILPNLIAPDPQTGKKTNLWMSAWSCMYSLELINKYRWRFVSERKYISEDVYSLISLYSNVKRVAIVPEALYFYCENDTSLTHVYRVDRYEKNKFCFDACQKLCDELKYSNDIKSRLAFQYISNIIGAFKLIVLCDETVNAKKEYIKDILSDPPFQSIVQNMNVTNETIKRRILFFFMRHCKYSLVYYLVKLQTKLSDNN